MYIKTSNGKFFLVFTIILFSSYQIFSYECGAESPTRITLEATSPQKVTLTIGKSIVITSPKPVKRVSLVSPEIADSIVLSPHQIYLSGKATGVTNLTLWGTDNKVSAILDIEVSPDISRLKEMLYKIVPEEKDLRLTTAHNNITLSGTVSSTSNLSQVLALTESYLPKDGKIINLLEVSGVYQVMLEVRVAEMSRSLLRKLGFNFNYLSSSGRNVGLSLLNNLTKLPSEGFVNTGGETVVTESINAIFRFLSHGTTWTVFIDALKEGGLLKVLAEPTLITLSGKTANFLAGGEFPVPVPQSGLTNTITIEYKPFGVGLNFTPTVLSSKKISMHVTPEVSELDFANAISISGFIIPALTTRRVSTVIELADGQSFAIAGLLKDDIRETISKFPLLGDIPIIGALFRSSSFRKNETELIVVVTPHLVKPLDTTKQTLPTDQYFEPDDFEFYLLGNLEGKAKMKSGSSSTKPDKRLGLEGNFGHILPK